jgi:D-amino-acid oxidase
MGNITVIGAGVSGLSCAVRLAENGYDVRVVAREFTPNTTSDVAAAIWGPYRCEPVDRATRWALESFSRFVELASDSETGVVMRDGVYGFPTAAPPAWTKDMPGLRMLNHDSTPAGCRSAAYVRLPMVEMDRYMPHLQSRVDRLGVVVEKQELGSLGDVANSADVIVNTSGLGAYVLVDDHDVYPVRGRVVRVEQIGLADFVDIETDGWPIGIFPRRDDIVLTGTYEVNEPALDVPPGLDDSIVDRCVAIEPRLASARRLGAKSGLRPARSVVRLETDYTSTGTPVVHNYGHGGGGVTLSWGCADEVVRHVAQALAA